MGGAFLSAEIFSGGREGEGWRDGKGEGNIPLSRQTVSLAGWGVFKSLRLFNSTLLTAGCLLQHNTYPHTQTHTS